MNFLLLILTLISILLFNPSHQKISKNSFQTCKNPFDSSCFSDPFEIFQNLKIKKNEAVKEIMFNILKETFSKIQLPDEFSAKVKSDEFLKEAIDAVMKSQEVEEMLKKNADKENHLTKEKDAIKEKIEAAFKEKLIQFPKDSFNDFTKTLNEDHTKEQINDHIHFQDSNFKYKPKNSHVSIYDWHDFYHYFPQLSSTIRLWKLQFKESARQNWKKFKGCANPGKLIDWLVPDIEDVKKVKRKTKLKSRRARQRDF